MATNNGELKQALLTKRAAAPEKVKLPEFPEIGEIHVRKLWGTDFAEYQSIWPDGDDAPKVSEAQFAAHMVALCACDETGKRIFASEDRDAISETWQMSALLRVANKAQRINGLGKATEETLEGNSETGQT